MTFIQKDTSKTWGELFPFLRDELTTQTGWSVYEQRFHNADGSVPDYSAGQTGEQSTFHNYESDLNGDGNAYDHDTTCLETPTGEYLSFQADENTEYVRFNYGDTPTDIPNGTFYASGYSNGSEQLEGCTNAHDYLSYDDPITFWLSYDADGFCLYWTREVGDGYDYHGALGFAGLSPIWDYSTANQKESAAAIMWHPGGGNSDYVQWNTTGQNDNSPFDGGVGNLNPDSNYGNYVTHDTNVIKSQSYENARGTNTPIGTHTRWVRDLSGSDTAHEDIIQDSSANNEFIILKEYYDQSNDYFALGMRIL